MPQTEIDRIAAIVRTTVIGIVIALAGILTPTPARAESAFASWAAVIVAGDYRTHGVATWAFDNARRDISAALGHAGFLPAHIRQLSRQPGWFSDEQLQQATRRNIRNAFRELGDAAPEGCLLYVTSRGHSDGINFGDGHLSPADLAETFDAACGDKPAIIIISACYSGVFVPALQSAKRMIVTAARADRTSFGCNESHRYPFFDGCILSSLARSNDFVSLARDAIACVGEQERAMGMSPPSEPQLFIGDAIAPLLKSAGFPHG